MILRFHKTLIISVKGVKFDWFVCVVYLLFGGQIARARSFLTTFSTTLTSGYLWSLRLLNSTHVKQEIASRLVGHFYFITCFIFKCYHEKCFHFWSHLVKNWAFGKIKNFEMLLVIFLPTLKLT